MDWEANLAAIIKCTDASLAQQFREFEDVTAEFTAVDDVPATSGHDSSNENVAAAYLRGTMAAEYRHRQQDKELQQTRVQTPSYSRVSSAFTKGSTASTAPTTFSEHFHRRQERKRAATTIGRAKDNQRTHRRGSEYEPVEEECQMHDQVDGSHYNSSRPAAVGSYRQQMYASPTYDMAQMIEQVRLSLKLEVDARAAIAERQLSALLQLCKATSEELDRLRVEVCANDRQLHTLDQVQSKIRQELTTQKDIGFHLQSMCGKDESWRMQTENQLLEFRQMVAALREQGNSTQAMAQEKLSRSELLVQFNAAMEPIKAQLQANLQHQAQQIAEITRTTSSSSLLLDGLTQKVNRGVTDELNELRSDLNALKHHLAKMDIFHDGAARGKTPHGHSPQPSKEELENKAKEELKLQMIGLREGLQKELVALMHNYVDAQTKPIQKMVGESSSNFISKQEVEILRNALEESCHNRSATVRTQADNQIKSVQDQLRGERNSTINDAFDRQEKSTQQAISAVKASLEELGKSYQYKQDDFAKMFEREQKDRKQALDELHELLRKNRHQLEDQMHTLIQENRVKLSQHDSDFDKRLKDVEKQIEIAVADLQKEHQAVVANLKNSVMAQSGNHTSELEQKMKRLEDTVLSTNLSVADLSKSMVSLTTASSSASNSDSTTKDVSLALEKQTSVYVSTMETLFHKMQLQMQAQPQVQIPMVPSPYHGFWPPSPFAGNQAPPPPILHLPPTLNPSSAASTPTQAPLTEKSAVSASAATNISPSHVENAIEAELEKRASFQGEDSTDQVRSAGPVKQSGNSGSALILPNKVPLHAMSSKTDAVEANSGRPSVPDIMTGQNPALMRSASSSALPVKNAISHVMMPKETMTPSSVPSTPTAKMLPNTSSTSVSSPPLPVTRSERASPIPMTPNATAPLTHTAVNTDTKSTLAIPVGGSAFSIASQHEVDSATENAPQLCNSSLPPTSSSPTPQVGGSHGLALSVPSPDIMPTAKEEIPPPLSPLAKLFARSTPPEAIQTSSIPVQSVPSGNIALVVNSTKTPEQSNAQVAPTTPSASSASDGESISHVLCELCRLPVRSNQKSEHEKSQCPKRMVECVSCKKQIPWVSLEIHELECNPAESKKVVTIGTNSSPSEIKPVSDTTELEGPFKKCRHCSADVPSFDLLEHEINCDKVLKQCPHCLRRQKMSELQDHIENCDCRLVSCPNDCGGKFLQRGIPNHLATRCPKKSVTTPATVSTPVSRPANPEAKQSIPSPSAARSSTAPGPTGKVECKFCDDEIQASKIDDHEQNCDWKPKRCQHCNMVVISRDLQRHETSCKTNMKLCPHCNENMPHSALTTHASRCSKRPIKCIRCCQLFPADAIVAHSTNCKIVPGTTAPENNPSSPQPGSLQVASRTPIKIPPPPPFPPPLTATTPVHASQQNTRSASADSQMGITNLTEETVSDRLARRNLALSQLTNPGANPLANIMQHEHNSGARASSPSIHSTTLSGRPFIQPDRMNDDKDEEDDEDEFDDEDDDDQLTLAEVVKEWSVENVCLWLHEDVGVPDVVLRFQQKHCNGEMLLELTESDLINDFGVRDRVQRERILSAIEAINTSNAYSDEDEEDDEDNDLEESEEYGTHDSASNSPSSRMRHSLGGATFSHPRDILRRKSQPSPQRILGGELPSSNDMLRRITSALENPKR